MKSLLWLFIRWVHPELAARLTDRRSGNYD